ncbi:MAG: hypothetical protein R3290_06270 [Acidimicrobiia bacterium]|nr:hypothetical protein [Acidimicrobiia bacterium]
MRRRLSIHLVAWVVGIAVIRVGVVPPEVCGPDADAPAVAASITGAVDWIVDNQFESGRYTYGYDATTDEVNPAYNPARHGGVTMSLYQTALWFDEGALGAADRGLAYVLDEIVERDGWLAWRPAGQDIPVGANALLLAGLTYRRELTGDPLHDDLMRGIAGFLVAQQQPDGSVFAYYDPRVDEVRPVYGLFATGEASWALARMERLFPGEGWGEAASATLTYMATERDRVEGRLTRLPDHWAAYTLSEMDPADVTEVQREYARDLAGFFGIRLRFEAQRRGTGLNLLLRWYPGPPAGVGTAGEGMAALWRLALRDPGLSDLVPAMEERILCTAGFSIDRQVAGGAASAYPRPELADGAWFYRGYTQMDGQQHVLSTMLGAWQVLEERTG